VIAGLARKATREIVKGSIVTPRASRRRALPHEGMVACKMFGAMTINAPGTTEDGKTPLRISDQGKTSRWRSYPRRHHHSRILQNFSSGIYCSAKIDLGVYSRAITTTAESASPGAGCRPTVSAFRQYTLIFGIRASNRAFHINLCGRRRSSEPITSRFRTPSFPLETSSPEYSRPPHRDFPEPAGRSVMEVS